MKELIVEIQEVSAKLRIDGVITELLFTPLRHNELQKLLIDLEKSKEKTEEEKQQILETYNNLALSKLREIKGTLKDFGEEVSLEQVKKGEISSALFKAIGQLFWDYHNALNPRKETEAKNEQAA